MPGIIIQYFISGRYFSCIQSQTCHVCHYSYYFNILLQTYLGTLIFQAAGSETIPNEIQKLILRNGHKSPWFMYKLARQAMRYGQHPVAADLFSSLSHLVIKLTYSRFIVLQLPQLVDSWFCGLIICSFWTYPMIYTVNWLIFAKFS